LSIRDVIKIPIFSYPGGMEKNTKYVFDISPVYRYHFCMKYICKGGTK